MPSIATAASTPQTAGRPLNGSVGRLCALDIVAQCRGLLLHHPQPVFDDVADRYDADRRSRSTTGMCRNLLVVIRSIMKTAVSASPQVGISRVMTCASRLVSASAPNSANVRTISRSDRTPMTRRSAPSTTRAPIRCSANVAIAASKVALGSIVTTSLRFLDRIALTVIGRLPSPATIPTVRSPGIPPTQDLGWSSTAIAALRYPGLWHQREELNDRAKL